MPEAQTHTTNSLGTKGVVFANARKRYPQRSDEVRPWRVNCMQNDEAPLLKLGDPDEETDKWEAEGRRRLEELIGAETISMMRRRLESDSCIHLRGLPLESELPPSPYYGDPSYHVLPSTHANIFGVIGALGLYSFCYSNENGGRIVRHVAPHSGASQEASSHGWKLELSWHVDAAYRPFDDFEGIAPAPRWIVWGVVYDQPPIPLTYILARDVLQMLPLWVIQELQKKSFRVDAPASFSGQERTSGVAILMADGSGGFFLRYNHDCCLGENPGSEAALSVLRDALAEEAPPRRLTLEAGDLIVLDNWRTMHMRGEFQPAWNGRDRWLLRVYASDRLYCGSPSIRKLRCWR